MNPSDLSRLRWLAERSIVIIGANQAASGAYLASPSFAVYRYSWLRDGAFVADAMSRAGEIDSAEAFFAWCDRVLRRRTAHIERLLARRAAGQSIETAEFLPTRFTLEGDEAGPDWTDFQLDGYGTWLWVLDAHRRRHGRPLTRFLPGAELSARYVAAFWEHPCYDWWEEHVDRIHVSTLAALSAGLAAAAGWMELSPERRAGFAVTATAIRERIVDDARRAGSLPKWLGSDEVDASAIAVATPFDVLPGDDPLVQATVARIEAELVHGGGVSRYLGDSYYGGGEWPVLAGFLGWHQARSGRVADAEAELAWIAAQATADGELPEQVGHHLQAPDELEPWLRRWGPIATPLLWSHAMYLILVIELGIIKPPITTVASRR